MAREGNVKILKSLLWASVATAALAAGVEAQDTAPAAPVAPGASASSQDAAAGAGQGSETIYIFGRAFDLTGQATSASEGVVGYSDFSTRPLLRAAELVEVMPGMIATQHSGGGKANQYFLRGFNLDHGTDFAVSIDGVPLNLKSHPHMNGYLDLNFLIPEVVERVDFHKGAHHADHGDFSFAAAQEFKLYDRVEQGTISVEAAERGFYRLLALDSYDLGGDSSLLYALDLSTNDGPWEVAEDLEHTSGLLKYTRPLQGALAGAQLSLEGIGYKASWNATDQMPLRAIEQGLIGRFGNLDPSLGGETERYIASAKLGWDMASLQVYAENYALDLYQNPTFFIDQVNGDQFVQVDRRWVYGANGEIERGITAAGLPVTVRTGFAFDYNDIGQAAVFQTTARVRRGAIRDDSLEETTLGVFGEASVHWTDKLRTTLGVRSDTYWYNVVALEPENSGDGSESVLNPKFAAAYALTDAIELYANYGEGFHSNDARGGVLTIDPNTGDPTDPSDVIVTGTGTELGARFHPSPRFNIAADVFKLELDSELIFVGDAGTSEPSSATERSGFELSSFWRPLDWLAFDGSASWSKARLSDAPAGEDRIPNSLDFVGSAGATVVYDDLVASVRVRHQGESPLIEDNSVRSHAHTDVNLGVSYDLGRFNLGVDVLNLLDEEGEDISYFYESQLLGEPEPVADLHFHPEVPRTFKLILKADF
jgi:outer membrane receptor protein involved in Fe transport